MKKTNGIRYTFIINWSLITALMIVLFLIYKSKVFLDNEAKATLSKIVAEQAFPLERILNDAEDSVYDTKTIIESTMDFEKIKGNQKAIDQYEKEIIPILESFVKNSKFKNIWYQANSNILGGVSLIGLREINDKIIREPKWDIIGSSYETADWWQAPKKKGENWSDIYYYLPWNKFLTSFGIKLEYNGDFLGIISIDVPVDEIKNDLSKITIYKSGFFVLLDSKYNYISSTNKIIKDLPEFDKVKVNLLKKEIDVNKKDKGTIYFQIKGNKALSYKKLFNGWILMAIVPTNEVTENATTMLVFIVLCSIIIILLVSFFALNNISILKKQYKIIEKSYYYDNITDLPNRVMLIRDLIKYNKNGKGYLAVVHIENIIEIFNIAGHSKTDTVLQVISKYFLDFDSQKIIKIYNSHSLKFEILLIDYNLNHLEEWRRLFNTYIRKIPICIDNKCIFLKVTMGVSSIGSNLEEEAIIDKAYKALEYACDTLKEYYLYNDQLERIFFTTFLVSQISNAIENNEFYLEYQPKLNLSNNSIEEVEALIRWRHTTYGVIPPNQFIPKLERTDTIKLLTNWVIEQVIADISEWKNKGVSLRVSINVTPRDLKDKDFVNRIINLLDEYGVDYNMINIEITETDLIKELDDVYDKLVLLREKGIKISIDDFGTGYSSLSYINTLPIDCIKIDRSFIKGLLVDSKKNKLIENTLLLLHNLEKYVVAEGVEDEETLNYLNKIGCEEIQGYYISRPLGKTQLEDFINNYQ